MENTMPRSSNDFHIFYGTKFLSCTVKKAKDFVQKETSSFQIPLVSYIHGKWILTDISKSIWKDIQEDRVLNLFNIGDYESHSILWKWVLNYLANTREGKQIVISKLGYPLNTGNEYTIYDLAKAIIFRVDFCVERVKQNDEISPAKIYSLSKIFTNGYKSVNVLANVTCGTQWLVKSPKVENGISSEAVKSLESRLSFDKKMYGTYGVVSENFSSEVFCPPEIPYLKSREATISFPQVQSIKKNLPQVEFTNISGRQLKLF